MLILTRKIGETVRINQDIHCTVLGRTGNCIKLGFTAPDGIIIHREEIHLKIEAKREEGAGDGDAIHPALIKQSIHFAHKIDMPH